MKQKEEDYLTPAEATAYILKAYTQETGAIVRSARDLSPLESWLILKVANACALLGQADRKLEALKRK